jgi:ribose 5-phosphate isomerase B
MKIYTGGDHAGVALKSRLIERLRGQGHEVIDMGPTTNAECDYPDYAGQVARAVRDNKGTRGVLVCGSGQGVNMAANKVRGVRAALLFNEESARLSRKHNDANVLCLGARMVAESDADAIVDAWFSTNFDGGRHEQRVAKIASLEEAEAALTPKK